MWTPGSAATPHHLPPYPRIRGCIPDASGHMLKRGDYHYNQILPRHRGMRRFLPYWFRPDGALCGVWNFLAVCLNCEQTIPRYAATDGRGTRPNSSATKPPQGWPHLYNGGPCINGREKEPQQRDQTAWSSSTLDNASMRVAHTRVASQVGGLCSQLGGHLEGEGLGGAQRPSPKKYKNNIKSYENHIK